MQLKISEYDEIKIKIIVVMLIRAGCVVLVSVVLALIPLYIGPFEYWNSRTSCIRNWSASVCCSGGVFVIYTARNPAFLFFPSQNSSNLARANNNAVDSINNYPLFIQGPIGRSSKKTCSLDPMPTSLVVESLDVLLPVITRMLNLSLQNGNFPDTWKLADV